MIKEKEQVILKIKYMKDKSFHGFINDIYFDRWYNKTEMDLFRNSFIRACNAMGKDLSSISTWEN